jgi:hypothetical protein
MCLEVDCIAPWINALTIASLIVRVGRIIDAVFRRRPNEPEPAGHASGAKTTIDEEEHRAESHGFIGE